MNANDNIADVFDEAAWRIEAAAPKVVKGPGITDEQFKAGEAALREWMATHYDPNIADRAAVRWSFELKRASDDWRTVTYTFAIKPIDPGTIHRPADWTEKVDLSDPDEAFLERCRRKRVGTEYKKPADALVEVQDNPEWGYRGMSWEEWQFIQRTGKIQSKESHNISQEGLTFFGDAPVASHYSSGFAPWWYKSTQRRPGVVIAVPRSLLLTSKDRKDIPSGELAHEGPLDASNIKAVWFIIPYEISNGEIEIIVDKATGKTQEGSRFAPSGGYAIIPHKMKRSGASHA